MNADRMIAVFLAGVLVGGTTVYLSPNNSLSMGVQGGKQGGSTGVSGGGAGGPAGGRSDASAQAATPSGDVGGGNGGTAGAGNGGAGAGGGGSSSGGSADSASSLSPGTAGMAGTGPGERGALQLDAGGSGAGGMSAGGDGSMGTPGQNGMPGAGGTPGGESGSSISSVPTSGAPQSATRLLRHLQVAPSLWAAQAEAASASKDPAIRALAARIAEHVTNIPEVGERMPPNTEVVGYLVDSKLLLERMKAAGMDVGSLATQVDEVSRARR